MDKMLEELDTLMDEIMKEAQKTPLPEVTRKEAVMGYESSYKGARQRDEVAMTPLMRNALHAYGDIPEGSDKRLMVNDPMSKAEQAIVSNIKQLLLQYNGASTEFNENIPLESVEHYNVQCHQNFKENLRDIQPHQADARKDMIKVFARPTNKSVSDIKKLLRSDPEFQAAIKLVMENIPSVRASDQIREINLPFMTKHSGVGYPYWKNDRTIVDGKNMTYAELTMQIAERLKEKYSEWYKYNVSTVYGRNQRGKGRLLIAVSRVLNLLLNQLESEEISAYKLKSSLFIGYRDDEELKKALIYLCEDCTKTGMKCANEDYSSYDSTVSTGMVCLLGAISIYKANGARSKKIALLRAVFAMKTLLIDGLDNKTLVIWGRILSGFIDTNRGGGIINAIQSTTCLMKQDRDYSKMAYRSLIWMMVMGDDNNHKYRHLDRDKYAKDMSSLFGGIINVAKYEYGPVFLQYRVFKNPKTNEWSMVYAWTRVVRSMLMKEESKGLGPVGWNWAWYQQLAKLLDYDEAFYIAVNLLIRFDENKFFMDTPISEQARMVKAEDQAKLDSLKTDAQRRRFTKTTDILYDGDPSKQRFALELSDPKEGGLLDKVRQKIKDVYDPSFYSKHGLI